MSKYIDETLSEIDIAKDREDVKELLASMESMDLSNLWESMNKQIIKYTEWLKDDSVNKYSHIGLESAIASDNNIFKRSWLIFKYSLSLNRDKSMANYMSVMSSVKADKVKPGGSNVMLNKESVYALFDTLELMSKVDIKKLSPELHEIVNQVKNDIVSGEHVLIIALLLIGAPILNLLGVIIYFIKDRKLNSDVQHISSEHSVKLQHLITAIIKDSNLLPNLKLDEKGLLAIEDIRKLSSMLNKTRMTMLPVAQRPSLVPKWLKSRRFISYEDKLEIAKHLEMNANKYINAMSSYNIGKFNSLRIIMSAEKLQNMYDYGYGNNITTMSIEDAYASLCTSLLLMFIDSTTSALLLTQDLRKY